MSTALIISVSVHYRTVQRKKRFKKSRRPASVAPMRVSTMKEQGCDAASSMDNASSIASIERVENASVDFSDIFTVATYDDIASVDDLESIDDLDDLGSVSDDSPSDSQNDAPPKYDGLFDYVTKL